MHFCPSTAFRTKLRMIFVGGGKQHLKKKTKSLFPKTNRGSTNLWVYVRLIKMSGCVYNISPFQ